VEEEHNICGLCGHDNGCDPIVPVEPIGWQPVETAPIGETVDVWVRFPTKRDLCAARYVPAGQGCRYTDVTQSAAGHWRSDKSVDTFTGRFFYDDQGNYCVEYRDCSEFAFVVTHWRPVPLPPEASGTTKSREDSSR